MVGTKKEADKRSSRVIDFLIHLFVCLCRDLNMFDFLSNRFSGIFDWLNGKPRISQDDINASVEKLFDALIDADVPHALARAFLTTVTDSLAGKELHKSINPGHYIVKVVQEKLTEFLGSQASAAPLFIEYPSTVMVLGLQGSGKTTTTAKLAHLIDQQERKAGKKKRILLASVDYYRAAAIDQLEILAKEIGLDFYRAISQNVLAAAREIQEYSQKNNYELLFLDTAGRLHIDQEMMLELKEVEKIVRAKKKILILDAMTGQESLSVAEAFNQAVAFDGAILTKMDSETRAGAAFSFYYKLKKPVLFIGVGEKVNDLEPFIPDRIASRIIGMGDILTLMDKAEKALAEDDKIKQAKMSERFTTGTFTLDDFLQQLSYIQKMGSAQKILSYLPGMPKMNPADVERGEKEMKRMRAISSSMTLKERLMPSLLNGERKKRIARGSGTEIADVNQMLQKFEQIKHFAKLMKNSGNFKNFFKK